MAGLTQVTGIRELVVPMLSGLSLRVTAPEVEPPERTARQVQIGEWHDEAVAHDRLAHEPDVLLVGTPTHERFVLVCRLARDPVGLDEDHYRDEDRQSRLDEKTGIQQSGTRPGSRRLR